MLTVLTLVADQSFSYGPRQSKSSAYNEMGKLNVEAKFTPFSCAKRRAPMKVGLVHRAASVA
jgi:hypothetical protein